jgi:hypothetical protein
MLYCTICAIALIIIVFLHKQVWCKQTRGYPCFRKYAAIFYLKKNIIRKFLFEIRFALFYYTQFNYLFYLTVLYNEYLVPNNLTEDEEFLANECVPVLLNALRKFSNVKTFQPIS